MSVVFVEMLHFETPPGHDVLRLASGSAIDESLSVVAHIDAHARVSVTASLPVLW